MSTSTICAYCRKPLLDREHALAHGPMCSANPTRAATRTTVLVEIADLAASLARSHPDAAARDALAGLSDALRQLAVEAQ